MVNIARNLNQEVTRWPNTGSDGFGGFTFGSPLVHAGRWEDKAEMFRDPQGREITSSAICYVDGVIDIDVGDFLAEGNHLGVANPLAANASETVARRVEQSHRTTNLRNMQSLRKVFM